MTKAARAQYTLEYKQEAVRLVESGQSIAAAARSLGVVEQTLYNWVKAQREGRLKGTGSKVSAEQMEISRLRAELCLSPLTVLPAVLSPSCTTFIQPLPDFALLPRCFGPIQPIEPLPVWRG
jgi:transposase